MLTKRNIEKKYGRLTLIGESFIKGKNSYYKCRCECGVIKNIRFYDLKNGITKSCGCFNDEKLLKHGFAGTKFYQTWLGMCHRCNNKKSISYRNYGVRGIKVCKRWMNFENFKEDMYTTYLKHVKKHGEKDTQIERENNNGNYCNENCSWKTRKENNRNKRTNKMITYKG